MFYKLIERKRNAWLSNPDCPVGWLLAYIQQRGMMRDAQIEAIKTYLFLKIACHNRPLWQLFCEGYFLTLDIDEMSLTVAARRRLEHDKAARTLYEYACLADAQGNLIAPLLKDYIEKHPDEVDYEQVFRHFFYGVEYPDYIFSLPMGAGKTYLMAAFIYLDLYFSKEEPDNPAFAHNFMVLVPSGLKSSIVPSLKTILNFDPTWILPDPTASQLRREISFEVLDEQKTANNSNLVRNPNAQKISNHQPYNVLRGLVIVTNAEKVILNKSETLTTPSLHSAKELAEIRIYNELRDTIARIPHLAIFIDEVHHASDGDIKLRKVVNGWADGSTFNAVLGFSGTPYLASADNVDIAEGLSIKNKHLANVVYYYPLIDGVGNFLKQPTIKTSQGDYDTIVRTGVIEFLSQYGHTQYADGTCAKLAIYCSRIETLEERVYPLVAQVVEEQGYDPSVAVLRYHGGNKVYPKPEGSDAAFASLDTSLSAVRIVLLAQIGKEGWDCRSLTGVILPQKGACPQNMVLQTACRCLRQVTRGEHETALIWLNDDNAKILNKQLEKQQNTSIEQLNGKPRSELTKLCRYSRMKVVKVPPIDFYQLKVSYETLVLEDQPNTTERLQSPDLLVGTSVLLVKEQDLMGKITGKGILETADEESQLPVTYNAWLHLIAKEGFGTIKVSELRRYDKVLRQVFDSITDEHDGMRYPKATYLQQAIRAEVRKAFVPRRDFKVKEEEVPVEALILNIANLTSPKEVESADLYYPEQSEVERIVEADKGIKRLKPDIASAIEGLSATPGMELAIDTLRGNPNSYEVDRHPEAAGTYHYLPYHFDSGFEMKFFKNSLIQLITQRGLEVYFNGDEWLTNFKIDCYRQRDGLWSPIGRYVPDFLILSRQADGSIAQILIVETKGEGFAAKFADKRMFMEKFKELNNKRFGYRRFDFLYIEDSLSPDEQDLRTMQAIEHFFEKTPTR